MVRLYQSGWQAACVTSLSEELDEIAGIVFNDEVPESGRVMCRKGPHEDWDISLAKHR